MTEVNAAELRRLDFGLLLVLDGALRHRKLSTVAERLGLTPSAVSHALARLRDAFGDPLFVRRPHGVEPTPRALELAGPVAAILQTASRALSGPEAFDPAASRRVFRVGALDHETALFASTFLDAGFGTELGFSVRPLARDAALTALRQGELDLALGFFWRARDGVERVPLYEERYAVAVRADHPAAVAPLTAEAYAALDHVLVSPAGDLRGIMDERLAELGMSRRVVLAVPYFFAAFAAVARSSAAATLPRRLAERHARDFGLVLLDPPLLVRRFPVHLAWAARDAADPGLSWLRDKLTTAAAAL